MKSTLARVLGAAVVAALLVMAGPGESGAATAPKPTAKVDVHQVVAGAQQQLALTVVNPVGALRRITSVRVTASAGLFTIAAPVDVAGWTGVVKGGFLTFTAAAGGGIAPGSSKTFGFVADAQRPPQDANAAWSVSTSTDTGTPSTYASANPSVAGALGTRVRTLEILDLTVAAPEQLTGTPALRVTAGQDNLVVAVRVANAGSAAQTATVGLTDDDGGAPAGVVTLAPGEIATVPLTLDVGDAVGHGKVVASAVAGPSVAATRFRAYVAEPRLQLTAVNLRPWEIAPGTEVAFQLRVDAAGAGAPDITVDGGRSELRLVDGDLVAPLAEDAVLADGTRTIVSSETVEVPDLPDGQGRDVLHLEGVDRNGAVIDDDVPIDDPVLVDREVPTAELALTVNGPAAGNGSTLDLEGRIVSHEETCEFCTVVDTGLEVLGADGSIIETIPVYAGGEDDTLLLKHQGYVAQDGEISGFWDVDEWPAGAVSTRWFVTAKDPSGLRGTSYSPLLDVDVVPPTIVGGTTADLRRLVVWLSEPVSAPVGDDFAPGDWTCTGAAVQRATLSGTGDTVVLGLGADVDRNATPRCTYDPQASPATDRMGYELAPGSVVLADGIAPVAPVIDAIDGRDADSGAFFASTSTPTLSISHVQPGDTIAVYEALPDGTDALLASGTASGSTIELTTGSLGSVDRSLDVYAEATDPAGGRSEWSTVRLVLDFTAPSLAGATVTRAGTRDIVLGFGEPLVGPAAANDWAAYTGAQPFTVSVAVDGSVVTLRVTDGRFTPLTMTIDGVGYDVLAADGSTRLTDRAGNLLADSFRAI